MQKYYKKLINLSKKAANKKCVPVSAIIVKNNIIISSAYNLRDKTNNVMDHAEIIAIKKANKKLKTWNLSSCELYVTMKPCEMCMSIINEARIKKIYYILDNKDYKNRKEIDKKNIEIIKEKEFEDQYYYLLKSFFKKMREK